MAECTLGVDIRRIWCEVEMLCTFGGQHLPGTPDGMFESWEGELTCLQVVRVPVVTSMSIDILQSTLSQTILTKVVKSQQWLRNTRISPSEFIVFCWLPFSIDNAVAAHAHALMKRVQLVDPRFSLRLRLPADAGALFPARFACQHEREASSGKSRNTSSSTRVVSESDVSAYIGEVDDSDDEPCTWDITWAWESDVVGPPEHNGAEGYELDVSCSMELASDMPAA